MYKKICVIVSNSDTKQFFVSNDHDSYDLVGFIPVTHYSHILYKTGEKIETIQDIINLYYEDYQNIDLLDLYSSN